VRILVADDDRVGATMLAAALARLRFEVEIADNGEDAWRAITRGGSRWRSSTG
jgi:CheY-like chemotaxis protein